ncbi:MAG: peptidoglycan DD-metalloendopeptidase family protein [Syntrophomonadaceae bacterium]|jgi:murein DD-endopeptidase MepM/ murein hydrolase activator NlpD|nr:peptidoglycan DD-metalloendopeptidase family protein [Syntrophomonadaceae bacterium]
MSSFKTRLLIALFLIIAVTWAYPETGQQDGLIHSLLSYATNTDYDVSRWLESIWYDQELSPASSTSALRLPCSYTEVVRHFGWYYNARTGDQAFNPGVVLRIESGTLVYPVLRGEVTSISLQENGYQVVLKHSEALTSVVRGLREVRVEEGETVDESTPLGRGAELLYLELKNQDGPINPEGFLASENPV